MGDRAVSSQVCIGNECFDLNTVQDGGFSGSAVTWAPSEQGFSSASKPAGVVCREVNGLMVCTNIYPESSLSSNFRPAATTPAERVAAKDNAVGAANSGFRETTFDTFPWMVPPQLAAQYGDNTQNTVARVNYTEAAPAYYTPESKQDVYQGPSSTQPAQSYDAYSFHQGTPLSRPIEASAAQPFDPYSFHQGGDRRTAPVTPQDQGDFRDKPVVTQAPKQEVQQPVRTCTPGGCPGQCHPRQNQYNPCRPCNTGRSCGGWYPGKVVGRIFGGRGRCR